MLDDETIPKPSEIVDLVKTYIVFNGWLGLRRQILTKIGRSFPSKTIHGWLLTVPLFASAEFGFHWPLNKKNSKVSRSALATFLVKLEVPWLSRNRKKNRRKHGWEVVPVESLGRWNRNTGEHIVLAKKKRAKCSEMDCFFFAGGRWKKGEGNRKSCCGSLFVLDLKGRKMPIES